MARGMIPSIEPLTQASIPSLFAGLPTDPSSNIDDEIVKYRDIPYTVPQEDVLKFWQEHELEFPGLSSVSKKIFSLPASTSYEERSFSRLKNFVTEKRTR